MVDISAGVGGLSLSEERNSCDGASFLGLK